MVIPRAFSSGALSIWSKARAEPPERSSQNGSDCSSQGSFAVVNVADSTDVNVRF